MRKHISLKKLLAVLLALCLLIAAFPTSLLAFDDSQLPETGLVDPQQYEEDYQNFLDAGGSDDPDDLTAGADYVPGELIVEVISEQGSAAGEISELARKFGMTVSRVLDTAGLESSYAADISPNVDASMEQVVKTMYCMETEGDVLETVEALNESDSVYHAQPNYLYYTQDEPEPLDFGSVKAESESSIIDAYIAPAELNQSLYQEKLQWWMEGVLDLPTIWNTYNTMGDGVVVGVIDTGCNTAHPDIIDSLWTDSSGAVGYYAQTGEKIYKNTMYDANGHGSHVIGTIAMSAGNGGLVGVAPNAQIMVLQADDRSGAGSFSASNIISCLQYAMNNGADIVNMSLGSSSFDFSTYQIYQKAAVECVIVAAAGNNSQDTTSWMHFPGSISTTIGVMASNNSSNPYALASFTNHDTKGLFYDVVAPGTAIWSLSNTTSSLESGGYTSKNGTSMATPVVSGLVALYMSYRPGLTASQVHAAVLNSTKLSTNKMIATPLSSHTYAYNTGATFKFLNPALLMSYSPPSLGTAVTISDSTLKSAVYNALGVSTSKSIYNLDLQRLASVDTSSSFTAFSELYTRLPRLNNLKLSSHKTLSDSNITSYLSGAPAYLLRLELSNLNLTNLNFLRSMSTTSLFYLDVSGNKITNIAMLSKFTAMHTLRIQNNQITDISCVASMPHLENLYAQGNQIQDASPLATHITGISGASSSYGLRYCKLGDSTSSSGNQLTSVAPFTNFRGYHLDLRYNYLGHETDLATKAGAILAKMQALSANSGNTVVFYYTNQTTPTLRKMTTFSLTASKTISRAEAADFNLNSLATIGSTYNYNNYLLWSTDVTGMLADSSGDLGLTPTNITSTRTIRYTAGMNAQSGIDTTRDTLLTITAPEIYNAVLSTSYALVGQSIRILAFTNTSTTKLSLNAGTNSSSTVYEEFTSFTDVPTGSTGETLRRWVITVPASVLASTGTKSLYLFAGDSAGYSYGITASNQDKYTTPAYKYLSLYVRDTLSEASTMTMTPASQNMSRTNDVAVLGIRFGTAEFSSGTYTCTTSSSTLHPGTFYSAFGLVYLTANNTNGTPTVTETLTPDNGGSTLRASATVTKVSPTVLEANAVNSSTYASDGYVLYEIATNPAATYVTALNMDTGAYVETSRELIWTRQGSVSAAFSNSTSSRKLWHLRVPLVNGKPMEIAIAAGDSMGAVTEESSMLIPAVGVSFNTTEIKLFLKDFKSANLNDYMTYTPANANTGFAAFSTTSTAGYITLNNTTGLVTAAASTTSNTSQYGSTTVTATLPNGEKATVYVRVYNPRVNAASNNPDISELYVGGAVHYTVETYGADTLDIQQSGVSLMTLTNADTDRYTDTIDADGYTLRTWNFSLSFDSSGSKSITVYPSYTHGGTTYRYGSRSISTVIVNAGGADYSAWQEQLDRIPEDLSSYLQADIDAVHDVIGSLAMNLNELQQSTVDQAVAELEAAIDYLLGLTPADYSAYDAIVIEANEKLAAGGYANTAPLLALLEEALDRELLRKDQGIIDTLTENIRAAIDALAPLADYSAWQNALTLVPENYDGVFQIGEQFYVYRGTLRDAVTAAIADAPPEGLSEDEQELIYEKADALAAAVAGLASGTLEVTGMVALLTQEEAYAGYAETYHFPETLYKAYTDAVSAAKAVLDHPTTLTRIYTATDHLQDAMDALAPYMTPADYDAYDAIVTEAKEKLAAADYANADVLTALLEEALDRNLFQNDQTVIDSMVEKIRTAMDALLLWADYSPWQDALALVPDGYDGVFQIGEQSFVYPVSLRNAVTAAVADAPPEGLTEIDQALIREKTDSLIAAIAALAGNSLDVTDLISLLAQEEAYAGYAELYSFPEPLYNAYMYAIAAGKAQLETPTTLADINGAAEEIQNAMHALVPYMTPANYDVYNAIVAEAQTKIDSGEYVGLELLKSLLAEDISGKLAIEQAIVDDMAAAIQAAMNALELRADYTVWTDAVASVPEGYLGLIQNQYVYTASSRNAVKTLLENPPANDLPASKQEELNQKADELAEAVLALEKLDVSDLISLLGEKQTYQSSHYPEALYMQWTDALAEGERFLADPVSADVYTVCVEKLTAAKQALDDYVHELNVLPDSEWAGLLRAERTVQTEFSGEIYQADCVLYAVSPVPVSALLESLETEFSTNLVVMTANPVADAEEPMTEADADAVTATGMELWIMIDDVVVTKYTIVVLGDLTGDGKITTSDAGLLKQWLTNPTQLEAYMVYQLLAADVNEDGKCDLQDILAIMNQFL